MKTNKNQRLWIVIVFLSLLNVATIGTIVYNNRKVNTEEENIVFEPNTQPINGMYFSQTLGFDNSQMEVFRQSSRSFRRNANQIIISINGCKEELFGELQAEQPDTAKMKDISREIGSLHAELKEATINFYIELNKVCKPGQKDKLKTVFVPLFRKTPILGAGCGHGIGRGRGCGNGNRNY